MCIASSECTAASVCVAGRCQPDKPNVKPAVDAARRLVVRPVDMAYVRRGGGSSDSSGGALPPMVALGRDSAVLFLRFSVALPQLANVVEAYVVLHREGAVDDDPAPISLHATRIVDAWEGRSISWALQPRVVELRTPATLVEPGASPLVRVDVRDLVRQWARHDPRDQGIAIVAENESRTGTTFALTGTGTGAGGVIGERPDQLAGFSASRPSQGGSLRSSSAPDVEPYLELYVR
jgi:hypothetical protein